MVAVEYPNPIGSPSIRVFRSLRHKNYALFWSSDLIASVGQFVREVALYWLAYEITGSAWALGILGFCEAAPRLLLGAVGGVIVDRYDRLRLLTAIQFLCCIPVFGLVALYFLGILQFLHMAVLETLWATMRSMNPTAGQSILRELVPETELMSAVSLYSIGFNFARIVGPSIGGVLILWIGGRRLLGFLRCVSSHFSDLIARCSGLIERAGQCSGEPF